MATPDNSGGFVQGLLQSLQPWMTGGSQGLLSGQYGGTSGLMDAMLQAGGPDTTYSRMGAALTKQKALALDEAAQRQQLAQQNLSLGFQAARMPLMLAAMRQRMQQFGAGQAAPQPSPQSGAPLPAAGPVLTSNAPASQPAASGPSDLLNAAVQDSILGLPWANAELTAAKTGLQYDPATATRVAAAKNQISQDQLQLAQAYASGNPQLIEGMKRKLLTDAPPSPFATVTLPDGRTAQIAPGTGKMTILPASPLEKVLGPDGTPVNVPLAQAAGRTPYSPFAVTASQMNGPVGALDAALTQSGVNIPGGRGGQMKLVTLRNLIANNPGKSPEEIAEQVRTGQLDFNGAKRSTGQLATIAAASNAQMGKLDRDFAAMEPLVSKLPNAPAVINRALAQLTTNFKAGGDKETAALLTYFREAATEYAKLSSGSTGSAAPAEGQINESLKLFQNAFTQGGYAGMKQAILQSAQNKRDAYSEGLRMAAAPGAGVGAAPTAPVSGGKGAVNALLLSSYAQKHGITEDAARQFLSSQGYQVQ